MRRVGPRLASQAVSGDASRTCNGLVGSFPATLDTPMLPPRCKRPRRTRARTQVRIMQTGCVRRVLRLRARCASDRNHAGDGLVVPKRTVDASHHLTVASRVIAGPMPASPPRSRAVWDRRQALQPPLRRPAKPSGLAVYDGRSASGSQGTVKFCKHKTSAPLPRSGVSAPALPVPRKPHPRGQRRHRASDTLRQRER